MDQKEFLKAARHTLGALSGESVEGFRVILDEAERRGVTRNRVAYILATAWWETARTMQPVREAFYVAKDFAAAEAWRKAHLHYFPYYGRGYVQLTWKANYRKASEKLGTDFIAKPDLVMEPDHAVKILFTGMEEGWFTGKALDDYIDDIDEADAEDLREYINARRIINGADKAETIGKLATAFESALKEGGYAGGARIAGVAGAGAAMAEGFEARIEALGLRHFKPYEFLAKGAQHSNSHSSAHGLNADPPKELWDAIGPTAKALDELRHRLGKPIVMASVYRSPAYNAAIGGASKSQHVRFTAVDFAVQGSPVGPAQWAAALREMRSSGAFSGGIGTYATFVHVDTRGENVDWSG